MPRTTRSFNLNTVAAPSRASYPVYPPRQALLALYDSVSVRTLDNTQKVVRKAPDLLAFLSACLVFGVILVNHRILILIMHSHSSSSWSKKLTGQIDSEEDLYQYVHETRPLHVTHVTRGYYAKKAETFTSDTAYKRVTALCVA